MTDEKRNELISRISSVTATDQPKFGKMNVAQMICHCADQLRMVFGEIEGLRRQQVDIAKIREMAARGESLQTVDGLDQVAGEGTMPTDLESDKQTVINYLNRFCDSDENVTLSFHPFFGEIDRAHWDRLVVYHLNHHLSQFGR